MNVKTMNTKEIYMEPVIQEDGQKEVSSQDKKLQGSSMQFSDKILVTFGEKERIVRSEELAYTKEVGQSEENSKVKRNENPSSEEEKKERKIDAKQVKNKMYSLCNRLSEQDCKGLKEEGFMTLKKYRADQVDRAIDRVKKQRAWKEKQINKQIDQFKDKKEDIENMAVHQTSSDSKDVIERLKKSNLPITDENVARFTDALSMMGAIHTVSSGQIATMVGQGTTPNVESIYKASYSGSQSTLGKEVAFQEMQPEISKLLESEGLDEETSMNTAKVLLDYGVPITKETITSYEFIESLKQRNPEEIEQWLFNGMGEGTDPTKVDLSKKALEDTWYQQAEQLVKQVEEITEEDVEKTAQATDYLTLQRLYWTHQGVIWQEGQTSSSQGPRETAKITAKRQLEEIRLKLTVENAYSMYKQGIHVDTSQLSQVIDELRSMEKGQYQDLFGQDGIVLSSEQISLYQANQTTIDGIKNLPSIILGVAYENQGLNTLREIGTIGQDLISRQPSLMNEYEKVMTVPRKDLGDSIQKAFDSLDALIDELQLENTDANKRAIRILAYNQMPINKESVEEMKAYHYEVSSVLDKLTPQVTMELIKEGNNPIETNISELSNQIDEKRQQLGTTEEEKFSEYLYRLDRKKEIRQEEREAYIGLYRLLHQVEKSDGAAVGSLVKSGQEVTLKNLLTAVRSQKASGMDITLEKETSGIEVDTSRQNSITGQIEQGFQGRAQDRQSAYQQSLASSLYETVDVEQWEEVSRTYEQKGMDPYAVPLEQLKEDLSNANKASELLERKQLEEIRQAAQVPTESIEVLTNNDLPLTIENIISVNGIQQGTSSLYQQIAEAVKESNPTVRAKVEKTFSNLALHFEDEKVSQENHEILQESLGEVLEEQLEIQSSDIPMESQRVDQLLSLRNQIALSGKLASKAYYQVPMKLGDELLTVNVQLQSTEEQDSKIHIKTKSDEYGQIEISLSIQNQQVDGLILCEKRQTQEQMQEQLTTVKEQMKKMGFDSKQLITTVNQKTKPVVYDKREETETKTSTQELYQLTKVFLRTITNLST